MSVPSLLLTRVDDQSENKGVILYPPSLSLLRDDQKLAINPSSPDPCEISTFPFQVAIKRTESNEFELIGMRNVEILVNKVRAANGYLIRNGDVIELNSGNAVDSSSIYVKYVVCWAGLC